MPVLDWIPPPNPNPWDLDLGHLGLPRRAYRLLRLQGFHTVRAIALAIHTGSSTSTRRGCARTSSPASPGYARSSLTPASGRAL